MSPRVLIADQLSPAAVASFQERGVETDVKAGLSKEELERIIPDYDGLAASQVLPRLAGLEHDELVAIRDYESAHRNRRTVLGRLAQLLD